MYLIVPAWSIAGALDWLWHRQTKIETTSGPKESFMHLMMMAEAGIPVLAGLFLEVNAGTPGTHDGRDACSPGNRNVGRRVHHFPKENCCARAAYPHLHGDTPFDVLAVFACFHPDQFRSMLGFGPAKPDFSLRLKNPPLPVRAR
jgi:hypothetical protein